MIDGESLPIHPMKPAASLTVEIRGDEATLRFEIEQGAPEPVALIEAMSTLTAKLAEKRLAWWEPIDDAPHT